MKPFIGAAFGLLVIAGCASSGDYEREEDRRGLVMDHQSASDRGGVGNYLFRKDYGDEFADGRANATTARSEEEVYWQTTQSSPTWQPSAELVGDRIEISDEVRFKLGSAELTEDSKKILDDVAAIIMNNDESLRAIEVAGHTDETGTRALNQRLSEERAKAVRDYLTAQGVAEDKLVAVGYGDQRPKYDPENSSAEEISQNRRVEFSVQERALAE